MGFRLASEDTEVQVKARICRESFKQEMATRCGVGSWTLKNIVKDALGLRIWVLSHCPQSACRSMATDDERPGDKSS